MTAGTPAPLVVHGWTIFVHPLFLAQVEALIAEVEALKRRDPAGYTQKNASKRLAAIAQLAFDVIPQDPARPEYRQGGALGDGYRHWFRARFFQQYRLFFRYHASSKVIVYAWVNDEATLSPGGDLRRGQCRGTLRQALAMSGNSSGRRMD
jgi:toxin YhaV